MSSSASSDDRSNDSERNDTGSLIDQKGFKNELLVRISDVHSTGSFATFGTIDSFVHPGISIEPIGTVRMPLSEADARSIILASHKAPFGKGTETMIDESVRKEWQVDAGRVQFLNPRWQSCLNQTVERVAGELGVADVGTNIRAELYKMLLYEKGALFKAHKDTEKIPGVFATLTICLPSQHTGGAVRLQHGEKSARFDTSESSAFDTTFIAWYTDVTHEIEPVQTGHRWVLTYNLINESQSRYTSASALDARTEDLAQALAQWHNLEDVPQYLAHSLDHQYTDIDLRLARLKGDDYHRARHVAQSCTVHQEFYVLLANMESHMRDLDYEAISELPKWISLTHIVDLDGFDLSVHRRRTISDACFLHKMSYEGRMLDVRWGGHYLENQYPEIDPIFKDSVMIIVPKPFIMGFLLSDQYSPQDLYKMMGRFRAITANHDATNLRSMLLQICSSSLCQKHKTDEDRNLYLGPVAVAAAFLGDASLFANVVEQTSGSFEIACYRALGELICLQNLAVQEQDLVVVLTKSKKLYEIHANLNAFHDGFLRGNPGRSDQLEFKYLRRWIDTVTMSCLDGLDCTYAEDASILVRIVLEREEEPFSQFMLYQGVRVFVDKFRYDKIFNNALMVELFFHLQQQHCSGKFLESLLPRIIESAISTFDLPRFASYLKIRLSPAFKGSLQDRRERGKEKPQGNPGGPIKAFYEYISAHKHEKVSQWLQNIQAQASGSAVEQLKDFLISFLKELILAVDVSSIEVQRCIHSLVTAYIIGMVGREPIKASDWARPDEVTSCSANCGDCSSMNIFLMDPELQRHTLSGKEDFHVRSGFGHYNYFDVDEVNWKPVAVTKTTKWWDKKHREWEIRASHALKALRRLPQAELKRCLAHRYDEIMDLRVVKAADKSSESKNQGGYETEATVPQKRPRDDAYRG